jgi:hypothetical protein|tara:strand:- start:833 stop:970 length:138 start_codon:yes stop_codon:yes gene_type:complete
MKTFIVLIVLVILFTSEVLIFKKKNWNKLVENTGEKYEEIMDKFD